MRLIIVALLALAAAPSQAGMLGMQACLRHELKPDPAQPDKKRWEPAYAGYCQAAQAQRDEAAKAQQTPQQ